METEAISVSGLSSGGYFAVQFHVAFSSTIMGAGIVAGGNRLSYMAIEIQLASYMQSRARKKDFTRGTVTQGPKMRSDNVNYS